MVDLLIVDDSDIVLFGVKEIISAIEGVNVVGAEKTITEGLSVVKEHQPDVVLLDIELPEINGIEAISILREVQPGIRIIILSVYEDKATIKRAMQQGANGYLPKTVTMAEMKEAIETVMLGETFISVSLLKKFMNADGAMSLQDKKVSRNHDPISRLSDREREVLQLILKGYTDNEIAEALFLSFNTIKSHRKNILLKTGSRNAVVLAHLAYESGLY
jgi:DNA-binding NarL/FixJ family response regulator